MIKASGEHRNHAIRFSAFLFIQICFTIFTPLIAAQKPPSKTEIKPGAQHAIQEPIKFEDNQSKEPSTKSSDMVTWRDILDHTRKTNDRTLAITTHIVQSIGVVSSIIAVGLAIAGYLGIKKFESFQAALKIKFDEVNRIHHEIENRRADAEKANKLFDAFTQNMMANLADVREKSQELSDIDLSATISNEVQFILNDFIRKTDLADLMGIQLKPEDYLVRGNSLLRKEFFNEAILSFNKALKLNPKLLPALLNKGIALLSSKRAQEAIPLFEEYIKHKPNDTYALRQMGLALYKTGRHEEAIAMYDKAINISPVTASAWYNRACIFSLIKKPDQAIQSLAEAINLNPEFKSMAITDKDFELLWNEPEFKEIVK